MTNIITDTYGLFISEHIYENIYPVIDDIFTNTIYSYYKHLRHNIDWKTSSNYSIHSIQCKYVILIGNTTSDIESVVEYRGTLLLPNEENNFLWNDSFHPKVRIYSIVSEEGMYINLLKSILNHGSIRIDRTNVGTHSIFGKKLEFSLQNNTLPMLTSKKVAFRVVLHELLWFLKGSTNTEELQRHNIKIWDGNSTREFLNNRGLPEYKEGELGPIYGFQWRNWGGSYKNIEKNPEGIDQINNIITTLKHKDFYNRRMILSAWNVGDLSKMVLPPCHCFCQFYVSDIGLCCALTQRSADVFLGLPFNITSYALLTHMIAHVTQLKTDKLIINLGDTHIYNNHIEQCKLQLQNPHYEFPMIHITKETPNIDELVFEDFNVVNYKSNPTIRAPMAI
tara:strand:+ start:31117 stop:32298 length:1182 start_codon:yes stop_codon:yes gene_type:complete